MSKKAQNQPGGDPKPVLALPECRRDPVQNQIVSDPPLGMALRIEEDLGMAHGIGMSPLEVGQCQVEEILPGPQHIVTPIVDGEKRLQVREFIGPSDFLDSAPRQLNTVLFGQGSHHLGFKRSLDMQVQFSFWKDTEKFIKRIHGFHVIRIIVSVYRRSRPSCALDSQNNVDYRQGPPQIIAGDKYRAFQVSVAF